MLPISLLATKLLTFGHPYHCLPNIVAFYFPNISTFCDADKSGITTVWWTLFRYASSSFVPRSSKPSGLTHPSEECSLLRF